MTLTPTPSKFLQAILEGFLDGILVITDQKQLLYINHTAKQLYQKLGYDITANVIPQQIWQSCEALLEIQELHTEKSIVMESEIEVEKIALQIRVQWLEITQYDRPCLLVRLQDQQQELQTLAIAEARKWQLTERETQVWILRRTGSSRKQIASELYISEDTVKKHLGNINIKRQICFDEEEWQHYSRSSKLLCSA